MTDTPWFAGETPAFDFVSEGASDFLTTDWDARAADILIENLRPDFRTFDWAFVS